MIPIHKALCNKPRCGARRAQCARHVGHLLNEAAGYDDSEQYYPRLLMPDACLGYAYFMPLPGEGDKDAR